MASKVHRKASSWPAARSASSDAVSSALLRAAEDALRAAGHEEAFLWTFEANGLARAFYERHGWELVGGRQERIAPEVRYRRGL